MEISLKNALTKKVKSENTLFFPTGVSNLWWASVNLHITRSGFLF
jgi:hypothetical protein